MLQAGVASGNMKVFGSIIRNVDTGRIVGHLQETSGLLGLVAEATTNPLLASLNLVSSLVSNVQNEQIKSGLEDIKEQNEAIQAAVDVVQQLQVGSLVLSGVGIAVSVAGTAILMKRLDRLSANVAAMHKTVDQIAGNVAMLRQEAIDRDLAELRTVTTLVDHAWMPSATDGEWRDIAMMSLKTADQFRMRIERLLEGQPSGEARMAAVPFLGLYAQASQLWVTSRMAAGQDDMARAAARQRLEVLSSLGLHLTASQMITAEPVSASDEDWLPSHRTHLLTCRNKALAVREHEIAALGTAETLTALEQRKIPGREWLAQARSETTAPFLFLPGPDWDAEVGSSA